MRELALLRDAHDDRRECGDVFLLLQLLEPWVRGCDLIRHFPVFFTYAGDDCSSKWSRYLRDPERPQVLCRRLQEALGVSEKEIAGAGERLERGEWGVLQVMELLEERLERTDSRKRPFSITGLLQTGLGGASLLLG